MALMFQRLLLLNFLFEVLVDSSVDLRIELCTFLEVFYFDKILKLFTDVDTILQLSFSKNYDHSYCVAVFIIFFAKYKTIPRKMFFSRKKR